MFLARLVPAALAASFLLGFGGAAIAQTTEEQLCRSDLPDSAISACTAIIDAGQVAPDKLAAALTKRGTAYEAKGEPDRAIQDFDRAIALDPKDATAFDGRGEAYLAKVQYDRAFQDVDRAIALDPKDARAFNGRGVAYLLKQQYERAIQEFDQAIALDPKDAEAFNGRGVAYLFKQQYDRAMQEFDQALALDPKNAQAFNNRGEAFRAKQQYGRAIQDYDQAIKLDPKDAMAFNNRGEAFRFKQQYDRAIQDYDQAIKLDPKFALAFRNRSVALSALGRYWEADADHDRAVQLDPGLQPAGQATRTWAYRGAFVAPLGLLLLALPFAAERRSRPLAAFVGFSLLFYIPVGIVFALGWKIGHEAWEIYLGLISASLAAMLLLRLTRAEVGLVLPAGRRGWIVSGVGILVAVAIDLAALLFFWWTKHALSDDAIPAPGAERLAFWATMPGVAEELMFRGVAMALLVRALPRARFGMPVWVLPLIITSLWFAPLHLVNTSVWQGQNVEATLVVILPAGFLYALIRVFSRSLLGGMLAHNASNLTDQLSYAIVPWVVG